MILFFSIFKLYTPKAAPVVIEPPKPEPEPTDLPPVNQEARVFEPPTQAVNVPYTPPQNFPVVETAETNVSYFLVF